MRYQLKYIGFAFNSLFHIKMCMMRMAAVTRDRSINVYDNHYQWFFVDIPGLYVDLL